MDKRQQIKNLLKNNINLEDLEETLDNIENGEYEEHTPSDEVVELTKDFTTNELREIFIEVIKEL